MNSNLKADCNTIFELDLDPIKVKLMHKESGEGWTRQQVDAVEFEYRRFLCLMKLFPHEKTAPLFDVDIFWHYHILDTMKYAVDCEQVFGYFLHHFPYAGLRGEDDEAAHQKVGTRMQELYEATFGEAYIRPEQGGAATAWSVASTPTTAWSVASTPLTARSARTTAWSVASTPAIAWSVASAPATAWSVASAPARAGLTALQNDPFYTVRPVLEKAA